MDKQISIEELEARIKELEKENETLRNQVIGRPTGPTVTVPKQFEGIFERAGGIVNEYFKDVAANPSTGSIAINNERYLLLRASALSHEFINFMKRLYADRGDAEAMQIGRNFLFDIAHVIGLEDARKFHDKMGVKDPVEKLSAGPIHFAYTGWAYVDILEESMPSPDENFFMKYHHPFSFEADTWIESGKKSDTPVCIMNSGYSSGWCEESFGIPLTAVEISCRAKGDEHCTFIMAPPDKIQNYLSKDEIEESKDGSYNVPTFFERKNVEEKLKDSLEEKEVLLKEIHHRVKNNLQIVMSLLNLQSDQVEDGEAQRKFKSSVERIRSMALIHEMLYSSEDLSHIDADEYFTQLIGEFRSSYRTRDNDLDVDLVLEMKDPTLSLEVAVPCGLIINELVSNSLKHAFKKEDPGKVEVEIVQTVNEENGTKSFEISVTDDGIGIPKSVNFKNPSTLGLDLVNTLADQLDATVTLDRSEGTRVEIEFEY